MSYKPNYILLSSAKYKINIAKIGYNPYDPNTIKNKHDFPDVEITRPSIVTEMQCLDTHALISVNGFIHPTVWMDNRLFVKGATTNMMRTNAQTGRIANHIGMLSFMRGEGLVKHPITEEMLFPTLGPYNIEFDFVERVTISFDKPVDGAFLVLAGYIVTEQPGYFERVNDKTFVLYPEKLNLFDRLAEMLVSYDIYNELGIEVSKLNDSSVKIKDLISNETMIKLLTRFNTFLVSFPGRKISYDKKMLDYTRIPNTFRIDTHPSKDNPDGGFEKSLVIGGYGKIMEYKFKEFNIYKTHVLTVDAIYNKLLMSYAPINPEELTSSTRKLLTQYRLSNCFFLRMLLDPL